MLTSLRTAVSAFLPSLVAAVAVVFTTIAVTAVFAFTAAVKAGEALLFQQVYRFLGLGTMLFYQTVGLDSTPVQADNLKGPSAADGHQIGWNILVT